MKPLCLLLLAFIALSTIQQTEAAP
jgi:hypothetical protein